jgi:MFS-type transporter involved in bile tolerance (Atg22 family)
MAIDCHTPSDRTHIASIRDGGATPTNWDSGADAGRALIGDHAPAAQKGTAFGIYYLVAGLLALPGAVLFGYLWQAFGETAAFGTAAALTLLGTGAFLAQTRRPARSEPNG